MNARTFNYEPLEDTSETLRIVEILPPSSDSRVRVRLRQATIQAEYSCLSYVWGDAAEEKEILLNDQVHRVRRNLFDFLQTAQRLYPEQSLWIDALCINQKDAQERNHQVQRMADIYSQAQMVLVWLGPQYEQDMDYFFGVFDGIAQNPSWARPAITNEYECAKERIKRSVEWFCGHQYWSRTWIAQEMLLARHVVVATDSRSIPWMHIARGFEQSMEPDISNFRSLRKWCLANESSGSHARNARPFWDVMRSLRDCRSEDRRDRVYGLLSLVERGQDFEVNYTEGVELLFWRAATFFGAWSRMKYVWMLFCALGLTANKLRSNCRLIEAYTVAVTVQGVCHTYRSIYRWTNTNNEYEQDVQHPPPNSICCERCCYSFPSSGADDVLYCVWLVAAQERTHFVVRKDKSKYTIDFFPHQESGFPRKIVESLGQWEMERSSLEDELTAKKNMQDLIKPGFRMRVPVERVTDRLTRMEAQNRKRKKRLLI